MFLQGYEDIDSQRKAENSYKFIWNENMMKEVESKIASFGGEETVVVEDVGDVPAPEEVKLGDEQVLDLFGVEEQRERPSSADSRIDDHDHQEDNREAEVKDEL